MIHILHRIDGCPPDADPADHRYLCKICGTVDAEALADGVHELHQSPWTHNTGLMSLWDRYLKEC